ncbi:MAG: PDZ domain-containing protein [Nitrospiraceae bacterium]|nr:PDZ domain-containing protein [Nitrospiraceae bacterium]
MGVEVESITTELAKAFGLKETKGAVVANLVSGGPAYKAGIKRGDIIVSFDGKQISQGNDLARIVAETPVGKLVNVETVSKGKEIIRQINVSEEK